MTADRSSIVPRLRFPEFRNDTDNVRCLKEPAKSSIGVQGHHHVDLKHPKKLLGDVCKIRRGTTITRKATRPGEVPVVAGGVEPAYFHDTPNRPPNVITISGSGANAGYVNFFSMPIWASDCMTVLPRDDKFDVYFVYCYLLAIQTYIRNELALGAAQPHVYPHDVERLPIPLLSRYEQNRIADCLGSLDDLIAAEGQKLEALRQHKQGLMQQLFPQSGETMPRLRFPEFCDAGQWIKKNLGDIIEVFMCKRIYARETRPDGEVPFYKIGTLGGTPDAFISKDLFEKYMQRYNFPRAGEILITCSGTVGKCLPYDGDEAYFQDSNIVWLGNSTLEVSNEFLLNCLANVNWSVLNSTTITRIYSPDLQSLSINFPQSKREQQRISDCLGSLDDLIAAVDRKLEALRRHKKGLMQQLFPSMEMR